MIKVAFNSSSRLIPEQQLAYYRSLGWDLVKEPGANPAPKTLPKTEQTLGKVVDSGKIVARPIKKGKK
jgi:hypothetical protein